MSGPFVPTAGATLLAMIGSPIAHAHLPATFNRRFAEEGIDAVMAPFDVEPAALAAFFEALRGWTNCRGCVVTAPHKVAAAGLVDVVSNRARQVGAVNVVIREADGRLVGDNVDGSGFVAGMRCSGVDPAGLRTIVFGCGGAGAAIALALAEAAAGSIHLVDPDAGRVQRLYDGLATHRGVAVITGAPDSLAGYDVVINATGIGLDGKSLVYPLDTVRSDALVADVLSMPGHTPWLRAAQARGCRIQSGSAMAEGQFAPIAERFGLELDLRR